MWYDDNMEQNYLTREAEQEAAFLSKIARYRGKNSPAQSTTENLNKSIGQKESVENGKVLFVILLIAITLLWTNSFFFPEYSMLAGLLVLPIFKLTNKVSNWRYGAYFVLILSFIFTAASLAKIMGAAF
jgi:hypothetical protein